MRGGELKRSINIEAPPDPTVTDGAGEPSSAWTAVYTGLMASIKPLFGRELIAAQQKHNTVSHKIWTRFVPGVNATMRVKYTSDAGGTRYFNILSSYNDCEDGRYMYILCEEGLVNG